MIGKPALLLRFAGPIVHLNGLVAVKPLLQLVDHVGVKAEIAQRFIYQVGPLHHSPFTLLLALLLRASLTELQLLHELTDQLVLQLSGREIERTGIEENASHQPLLLSAARMRKREPNRETAFSALNLHCLHQEEALPYLGVYVALPDYPSGALRCIPCNIRLILFRLEQKVALVAGLEELAGLMEVKDRVVALGTVKMLLLCLLETNIDTRYHFPLLMNYQKNIKRESNNQGKR